MIVCLDAGHGSGNVNGSPDGTYKEEEFTFDITAKQKAILEQYGIKVVLTRPTRAEVSLPQRVAIANQAGAALFVSNHSNAVGGGGWSSARGFVIFTSAAGNTAARNVFANKILAQAKIENIKLHNEVPLNVAYYVLRNTNMPAVLIEHGFHTNAEDVGLLKSDAYRTKLAKITCKGILDYLGLTCKADYDTLVKERFGLSDATMSYLKAYTYADALLEKLATKG